MRGRGVIKAALPWLLIVAGPPAMLHSLWSNPVSANADDVLYYFPLRKLAGQAIRAEVLGESVESPWPLARVMADPQAAVMHPLTWLFAVVPARPAYSLSIFWAFTVAGAGAYLYLRRIGLVRPAATFGAVAFMFCGFMVGHRAHLSMIQTAAMLPWGLWAIELLRRDSVAAFAVLVGVGYLAAAAGHWPTLIHLSLIWLVYFVLRARPVTWSFATAVLAGVVVAAIMAPQLSATSQLLAGATRQRIGYFTVGENSYLPVAAPLFLFPFVMGSSMSNEVAGRWLGPWNFCEMIGYVGLATLVLAGAAVWRLRSRGSAEPRMQTGEPVGRLVRLWMWLAIGAMVWMLGYYLPTYRLIHMIPVLGIVRCPARMLLLLDLALAVLAALAIHAIMTADRVEALAAAVKRGATRVLPMLMIGALVLLAGSAWALWFIWPERIPFPMNGGPGDILSAVRPDRPAVWAGLILLAATIVALRYWLARPRRRWGVLIIVLLADLYVPARFIDVPAANAPLSDPDHSPAAAWLKDNAPAEAGHRVWGVAGQYDSRPTELLLPMTSDVLGLETLSTYGPFHSAAHGQLLGFRIFGHSRDWARLIRRNYLLSLYGVRYLVAEGSQFRDVIESVRIPDAPNEADGPNLLTGRWQTSGCEWTADGVLRMETPWLWGRDKAWQGVVLEAETIYRISLDARGPDGGADNFLRAQISEPLWGPQDFDADPLALMAYPEQIGPHWRHFEWAFRTPGQVPEQVTFALLTFAERPIEVRNVTLRQSHWPAPVVAKCLVEPGQPVYRKLAELPAVHEGDAPVAIYENTLWLKAGACEIGRVGPEQIEALKWRPAEELARPGWQLPDLWLPVPSGINGLLWRATIPAAGAYVLAVSIMFLAGLRRNRRN